MPTNWSLPRSRVGFTLLELLTVIAIIGILAALLFPSVRAARVAANKAKTRVQFTQWAAAIEGFRSEYGYYPAFDPSNLVNGNAAPDMTGDHLFHDILAGKKRDGSVLVSGSPAAQQNKKLISFFAFSDSDLAENQLVRDAFDNTEIAVLVDKNLDGVIDGTDYPGGIPCVGGIKPGVADMPNGIVRAHVAFYAPGNGATVANPDFILSWK
jgi:prepilin-type N-terminal cleavage/methylation domain-containing protein